MKSTYRLELMLMAVTGSITVQEFQYRVESALCETCCDRCTQRYTGHTSVIESSVRT